MRIHPDCLPCSLNGALRAGRIATDDEKKIKILLDEVKIILSNIPSEITPPEIARLVYQKVSEVTGNYDPYKEIKSQSTKRALKLLPSLKEKIEKSNDKLLTAIRIAIAGNVIDFGVDRSFDIEQEIDEVIKKDFAILDYDKFKNYLDINNEILYVGDNAGESVFDRILIEEMKKTVRYVVRGVPVINDATYEDAELAGIDKVATILSSGTDAPGTILKTCNPEFKNIFNNSKLIISKGQGNYEALSNEKRPIFFLLIVKCHVLANDIGVNKGDIILKGINI